MKPREERLVSPTGGAKGAKDIRLGGADALALLELGRVYGMGEKKYDRFNYLKGYPWSLSIDAMLRHLLAFMAGEEYDECSVHPGQHDDDHVYDPEVCDGSGLLHTSHVAWHGLTLTSFIIRGIGQDDRFAPDEDVSPVSVAEGIAAMVALPEALNRVPPVVTFQGMDLSSGPDKTYRIALEEGNVSHELVSPEWVGGPGPLTARVTLGYRGDWPPDTRVGGYLTCCGAREHTLECPQYRV